MRSNTMSRFFAVALLAHLGLLAVAPAQTTLVNATVVGTVTDETGAVIPGVAVKITNAGTNISQETTTDSEGRYRIANLQPGDYQITSEITGFRTAVLKGLKLEVNQTARYDITLRVGQISEKLEVVGEVALLKTDSPARFRTSMTKLTTCWPQRSTCVSSPLSTRTACSLLAIA